MIRIKTLIYLGGKAKMPTVEISHGEYFDKWSILQVKAGHLEKTDQLNRVAREMNIYANEIAVLTAESKAEELLREIYEINLYIWQLMDSLYAINDKNLTKYVELTLEITEWNKKRAFKKGDIDQYFNSSIREAKSYF